MEEIAPALLIAVGGLIAIALIAFIAIATAELRGGMRWMARALLALAVAAPLAIAVFVLNEEPNTATQSTRDQIARAPTRETERRPAAGSSSEDNPRAASPDDAEQKRSDGDRADREGAGNSQSAADDGSGAVSNTDRALETEGAPRTRGFGTPGAINNDEKWDVVPVFFGTDRARDPDSNTRISFTSDRAKRLELGRALVTVPKTHKVPDIERPWVYSLPFTSVVIYREEEDPAQHFTLRAVQALTEEEFLSVVRARLAKSSRFKDQALVFVHGFNTSFDDALYRTAQIAYDLKYDGAPLVYSWPSKGEVTSYSYDRESAGQAQPHLREFLELAVAKSGAKQVSIIAHSMGNQLLLPVLRDLRQSLPEGIKLAQLILAAPDVDRDAFEFLASEIKGIGSGVTLYANGGDRALEVSKQFWGGIPRAGDVPDTGPVIVAGVDTIDVTATNSDVFSLNHSGYAENKALLNDIQLILQTGERPPDRRIPILRRVTTERGDYWQYPGG